MPRKARTPPPPRRPVQAPRARAGRPGDSPDRRRWLVPALAGAATLAALAAILAFTVLDGSEDALAAAGCTVRTFPGQERDHVVQPRKGFQYNSFPPTTGPHHPVPAPWGTYDDPIEQFRLLHNLEHGGLVVQYGSGVPRAQVDEILEWYRDDPNGIVVAPLPALENRVSLAAWTVDPDEAARNPRTNGVGVLALCPGFDSGAFDAFKDTYAFRGPELFPREQLTPGS